MVLRSAPGANVPVYQVSGTNSSRSLPDWLARKRKKSLKSDPDFANRIELIQDFQFEEASNRIQVTRDGQFAMATGTYKPQIHVYDFEQLSLKFDRHTDAENVDFVLISDDWTKSVHLQNDRTIEFHAQGGIYTRSRIPKFGRSLAYNAEKCDLFVGASGNEVFRLNLDQGRFMAPIETESEGVNTVQINPAHGLVGMGGENGIVEFWDPRSRNRVGSLHVGGEGHGVGSGVTALEFNDDGLSFAAGTFDGNTLLYDLRSPEPLVRKDQGYGLPIKKIGYLGTAPAVKDKIYTADKKIVKIWDVKTGAPFTSLEPTVDINDVAYIPHSGMFFMANEGIPMHTYYVPAVGPAPKWCSFLDSITEELEERPATSVYENYKFVTRKELTALSLGHLIGSNVVKSYMHGYFIDMRLYEQAKLITDPYAHREMRERDIRKKIESERESRIRSSGAGQNTEVKVNKAFAATNKAAVDNRFKALFEDPEFEIDENSFEYKLLHGGKAGAFGKSADGKLRDKPRGLTAAETEDSGGVGEEGADSDADSDTDQDRARRGQARKEHNRRQRREKGSNADALPTVTASGAVRGRAAASFGEQLRRNDRVQERQGGSGRVTKGDAEVSFVPRARKPRALVRPAGQDYGRTAPRRAADQRKASRLALRGQD